MFKAAHQEPREPDYAATTVGIVCAYVTRNHLAINQLPSLIASVHSALCGLEGEANFSVTHPRANELPTPAQIRRSIANDALTSFIDGRTYKTLKRHLAARGLTPESYRAQYGLPNDYPMVAPGYAARRSALAKAIGLGVPGALAQRQAAE